MITAAITSAIVAICAFFGVMLSVAEIGAIAVVVKVGVVGGIFGYGLRWWRARKAANSLPLVGHESQAKDSL